MNNPEFITITDTGIRHTDAVNLVPYMDPILREIMPKFDFSIDNPIGCANLLIEAVTKYKGLGLSANQIGIRKRVFVAGVEGNYVAYFNPDMLSVNDVTELYEEGCLSFPGIFLQVRRPTSIQIKYQTYEGEELVRQFTGLTARIIQHELDHLNGITIIDKVSNLKLQSAMKKAAKKGHIYTVKGLRVGQ